MDYHSILYRWYILSILSSSIFCSYSLTGVVIKDFFRATGALIETITKPVDLKEHCSEEKANCLSTENYLFAHGIAESHEQAYWYTKGKTKLPHIFDGRVFTYDFPDTTRWFWRVNFMKTSLGQRSEILGLKSAYEQALIALHENAAASKELVLMGMSRGAVTALNFMSLCRPHHIKALIVESPFDSTASLATNVLKKIYLDRIPGLQKIAHYLMNICFWQHSTRGSAAKDAITSLDKELPVLFICSRQDKVVPVESTIALYEQLKKQGHHKVHLFIADHGGHGRILHSPDGVRYQAIVHAFYKKYGLTHDPVLAEREVLH